VRSGCARWLIIVTAAEAVQVRFSEHIDAICYTPDEFDRKKRENDIVDKAAKNGISII